MGGAMIAVELRARIRRLFYAEHWKIGTIAAELSLHHETVRRAVEVERFVNTTARVRPSMLDPYRPFIEATLAQHPSLRATRLLEMLRARGYEGSAVQLRRCVARLRPRPAAEAYLRLSTFPGEQAQVDWAHFGKLRIGRAERPLSCFVMVLSWSRAMWARFVLDQQLESFLRCHQLAFRALGGVPRVILYDNLKSVVLERVGEQIRFHDRLLEFAGHHHYEPRPCAPYRGNEKGRVERRIRDLRDSFFAARAYTSLDDLNAQLARWIEEVAHARRVPGEDALVVREALERERAQLLPLPAHGFACDAVRTVHSGKTPYVRFDGNDYSIPHTLVRKPLTLVASDALVRLLDGTTEVARHDRCWDRGRQVECDAHLAALARHKREAAVSRGRDRLRQSCANADAFIAALIERRMHLGSQTARLLKLLDLHGPSLVDAALADALGSGAVNAAAVAHVIDRTLRARGLAPPIAPALPDDARVHDARVTPHSLADYDALLRLPEHE
jgi:transposase